MKNYSPTPLPLNLSIFYELFTEIENYFDTTGPALASKAERDQTNSIERFIAKGCYPYSVLHRRGGIRLVIAAQVKGA